MNAYEEKQEARRERYLERADKAESEAAGAFKREHAIADMIPMGQPILIGHHSERHHRRDIARMDSLMRKGIEANEKAAHYRNKADSVGSGGISSDDPDSVVKLEEKLAKLETLQAQMVTINKLVRKNDRAALAAMGLSEERINDLFKPDFCGRIGFADYQLTNNGANIRRIKQRIEYLKANAERTTVEHEPVGDVRVVENAEANRVQIFFPGKPADEIRAKLKSRGFRWAPSEGAWQRQLNNAGIYQANDFMAWYRSQSVAA